MITCNSRWPERVIKTFTGQLPFLRRRMSPLGNINLSPPNLCRGRFCLKQSCVFPTCTPMTYPDKSVQASFKSSLIFLDLQYAQFLEGSAQCRDSPEQWPLEIRRKQNYFSCLWKLVGSRCFPCSVVASQAHSCQNSNGSKFFGVFGAHCTG